MNSIYKVRLWTKFKIESLFVFIGTNISDNIKKILDKIQNNNNIIETDKSKLIDIFGKNYEKILGIDKSNKIIFIYKTINKDDNINIVCKKILVYLEDYLNITNIEEIYLWSYKKIKNEELLNLQFINNCFKKDNKIDFTKFQEYVKNFFNMNIENNLNYNIIDKSIAFKLLSDNSKQLYQNKIIESLLFKYVDDSYFEYIQYNPTTKSNNNNEKIKTLTINSYFDLTISFFDIKDDIIDLITIKDFENNINKEIYFPLYKKKSTDFKSIKTFINELDIIEKDINNYNFINNTKINKYISFLSLKGNELNFNKKHNLSLLFDKIHASNDIPFIKFKSSNNVFYKINKESLLTINSKDIDKWTIYKNIYGKSTNINYIVFKMILGSNSYCTLSISDVFIYDIKFNIKMGENITIELINLFYNKINKILEFVKNLYPDVLITLANENNLKIINLITYNSIQFEKMIVKYNNIKDVVTSKMYPYFNIIPNPDKNILHLQYKKIDNYAKFNDINAFITQHHGIPQLDLITRIQQVYTLSKEEAEKALLNWSSINEVEINTNANSIKIKPKNDNFVNIKLKLNEVVDTRFLISGLQNYHTEDIIIKLIRIILELTNDKLKLTKINIDNFDNQMFDNKNKGPTFEDLSEELKSEKYEEDEDDYIDDEYENAFNEALDAFSEFSKKVDEVDNNENKESKSKNKDREDSILSMSKKGKMSGYVLNKLKEADKDLFEYDPSQSPVRKDYAQMCGWVDTRQPIVINEEEKKKIDLISSDSYNGFIKTGSKKDTANKNYYICPKIWCPKSRVPMTYNDYIKNDKKCPYQDINEEPILFSAKYWGNDTNSALQKPSYIGILKDAHPNHYCLPCCFKLQQNNRLKTKTCKTNLEELNSKVNVNSKKSVSVAESKIIDKDLYGNPKYIKGEHYFPLELSRIGLLPKEIMELLGNKKCGNLANGTGLMEGIVNCYARVGIIHSTHSFISCISTLLNIPDLLNTIINKLTIEKYLMLENGKMLRLFINDNYDIHISENFKEFKTWFLRQKSYISKYNLLYKVKKNLESLESDIFTKNSFDIQTYKYIVREFMIYNSYKHFILYLQNDELIKDHSTLLDLINIEHDYINTERAHIIIINVDPVTNKSVILCPFNKNVKETVNLNNEFIFIIKTNQYYEPLSEIYFDGRIEKKFRFKYNESTNEIKNIINYYINNCGKKIDEITSESIVSYLESIELSTKNYVIDYNFKVRGVILKNNLYIPFKNKISIYNVSKNTFIYYNDILHYKCLLDIEKIKTILKNLEKYTKDEYYKISKIIVDKNDQINAVIINNEKTVIPLLFNKNLEYYQTFENDLEIFINYKIEDKRTSIMNIINENNLLFDFFFQNIQSYINNDNDIKSEIDFLINKQNPFPKNYRRKKLLNILENINKNILIKSTDSQQAKIIIENICKNNLSKNCIYPCELNSTCLKGIPDEYLEKFIFNMIETLLLGNNINIVSKIFGIIPNEVLLDQHDINNNKIIDLIEYQKNPLRLLSEHLDTITDNYIFENLNNIDLLKIYINERTEYLPVPIKWKKIFNNYNIIENEKYNFMYLYTLFNNINDYVNPNKKTSIEIMKSIVIKNIINNYLNDDIFNKLMENPSFEANINKKLTIKPSLDVILTIINSTNYYPSNYEISLFADMIGVNVIVIGRQTLKNPDSIYVYHNNNQYTVFLYTSLDSTCKTNKFNQFDLFVKNKKKIIFNKSEISEEINTIIEKKKKVYEIEVSE